MTYRLIIALRQFYKRREHVTKNVDDKNLKKLSKRNCLVKNDEHSRHRDGCLIGTVGCSELVTKKAQAENDMTKTLVAVVLMFMSCQVLNPIRRIMYVVTPSSGRGCGSTYLYFAYFTTPVMVLDAASHFFIYSVCNRRFVEKLSQKWRRLMTRSSVTPAVEQQPAGPAVVNAQPTPRRLKSGPKPAFEAGDNA